MTRLVPAAAAVPGAATPAGVWSCWLDGAGGTAADRAAAGAVQQAWPGAAAAARAGRDFARTVTWYAAFSCGIRQVLDVGAALPALELVSEAERQALRRCRVVRVASVPPAAGPEPGTGAALACADVSDPAALLAAAAPALDFAEPVLVLLVAVLDLMADDDNPGQVAGELAAVLAPGSLIAVTHLTADQAPSQVSAGAAAWAACVPVAWRPRSRTGAAGLFGGLPLLLPGLVPAPWWRPVPGKGLARPADVYAGVAGLPGDPSAIVTGTLPGPGGYA